MCPSAPRCWPACSRRSTRRSGQRERGGRRRIPGDVSRVKVDVPVQALAYRRAEAAAALGMSVEVFDVHVRPHVPAVRLGGLPGTASAKQRGVVVYPVAGLHDWLARNGAVVAEDLA